MKFLARILGIFCGLALVICIRAFCQPLPTTNQVQRITPARCPIGTIPTINSQGAGSDAPLAFTTSHKIVAGKPTRVVYSFMSDGDFCADYGTTSDTAPVNAPVGASPCTAGYLYKANVPYIENVYPTNRMDGACVTGTCHVYTEECVP